MIDLPLSRLAVQTREKMRLAQLEAQYRQQGQLSKIIELRRHARHKRERVLFALGMLLGAILGAVIMALTLHS